MNSDREGVMWNGREFISTGSVKSAAGPSPQAYESAMYLGMESSIDADAALHFQWRTECSFEVLFEMTSPTGWVCRLQVALAFLSAEWIGCYRDRTNNLKIWIATLGGLTLKRVRADTM
jgi:hypothetical protein